MLSILFLIFNFFVCLYFILKKDYAILGYIILFQEIHLIPFNNLGYDYLGFIYYIVIAVLFLVSKTKLKISKSRLKFLLNNKIIWALALITFIIGLHTFVIGLQSEGARTLVFRYFVQVLPAILYLILILDEVGSSEFMDQLAKGILLYGSMLALILITTTDALNIADYRRSNISDTIGISPIAITRTGCTMFITAFMLFLGKEYKKYSPFILVSILVSLSLIVLGTSRGPVLAMLTALLLYYTVRKRSYAKMLKSIKFAFPVLLLLIVPILYNLSNVEILQLYTERIEGLENYENMPRYIRYQLAFDFFTNEFSVFSPFFFVGAGPAGFDLYFGLSYAHNFILELIFEYGLFGFVSAALFIGYSVFYTYKLLRSDIPEKYIFIPLIVIYLLVASMFSGDLIGWRNLFFVSIIQIHIYAISRGYRFVLKV